MRVICVVLALCFTIGLAGCERISKPYIMTVDRVDQNVDQGNHGYLKGTPPPEEPRTGLKRPLIAVDMDLVEIKGKPTRETVIVTHKKEAAAVKAQEEQIK